MHPGVLHLKVRQTRLLDREYVVTKEDIAGRVQCPDSIARGRDYYTPAGPYDAGEEAAGVWPTIQPQVHAQR